ncbi:hypothetical protein [Clostridium magnum]|uniref:Uncharacterized protein n=1 Tax=Clostridium magnum DSM 2767 TaxID=1121326 RepID=A0A162RQ25_9CLOT|nr:hypothetical protein [Clostridium magnum]KZL90223.1 hypothetical protein CLMAG_39940 [Clostridium magnum DSM 2767]SHI14092.1 hypothetical protein SAMN02745944_02697 [Clostridium magnum DSM 2767]
MQDINDGVIKKWSAIDIQSEPVILVSKQNFDPAIPDVKISVSPYNTFFPADLPAKPISDHFNERCRIINVRTSMPANLCMNASPKMV